MTESEYTTAEQLPPAWRDLLTAAIEARRSAHAPYSGFAVGAALRTASGRILSGCNVENASLGLTVCAERVAIWKAISEGEHAFEALAVASESGATPCGACRQVMSEFVEEMRILVADTTGRGWVTSLKALLPHPFSGIGADQECCPQQ